MCGKGGFSYERRLCLSGAWIYCAQEDQRKGYCLEACSALLEYGFRELEFDGVQALVAEGNRASEEVCRRLGGTPAEKICWKGKKCLRFVWEA